MGIATVVFLLVRTTMAGLVGFGLGFRLVTMAFFFFFLFLLLLLLALALLLLVNGFLHSGGVRIQGVEDPRVDGKDVAHVESNIKLPEDDAQTAPLRIGVG